MGEPFQADTPQEWSPTGYAPLGNSSSYDLHPDGKRLALVGPRAKADVVNDKVVLIFNFFGELTRVPFTAGARLGPYEISGAIGAGGVGEVFRARDTKLNRDVAIKVPPAAFARDVDRRRRHSQVATRLAVGGRSSHGRRSAGGGDRARSRARPFRNEDGRAIDPKTFAIDKAATEKQRAEIAAKRGPAEPFDFGPPMSEILANCRKDTGLEPPKPPVFKKNVAKRPVFKPAPSRGGTAQPSWTRRRPRV